MSCRSQLVPLLSLLLTAKDTTLVAVPAGPYRPTGGLTSARVNLVELRGIDGLVLVAPGIELTNDSRVPGGSPTQIKVSGGDASGFANANGVFDADVNGVVAIPAAPKALWRPVWLVKLSSGTTRGFVWALGTIEVFQNQG